MLFFFLPILKTLKGYKGLLHRALYIIFSTTRYVKTLSDNNYYEY
jgi:hypothetical protein